MPESPEETTYIFKHDWSLAPGAPVRVDAESLKDLPPGLYRIKGTITSGDQTWPMKGRFGIFAKDLADRPLEDIPQWVGLVPAINILARSTYEESFDYMESLGVRHVRWLPGWGRLEPVKDRYEWGESDEFMSLVEQHRMQAMFCLSYYGADWTSELTKGTLARTPEGRAMWVEKLPCPRSSVTATA